MIFAYLQHRRDCSALSSFIPKFKINISQSSRSKQYERQERIKALAPIFHQPISPKDQHIFTLVSQIQNGQQDPVDIYFNGHMARKHLGRTNCLTEVVMAAAVEWAKDCNRAVPLAGTPVSLKDVLFTMEGPSSILESMKDHVRHAQCARIIKSAQPNSLLGQLSEILRFLLYGTYK